LPWKCPRVWWRSPILLYPVVTVGMLSLCMSAEWLPSNGCCAVA
jgi:hypothetical protein